MLTTTKISLGLGSLASTGGNVYKLFYSVLFMNLFILYTHIMIKFSLTVSISLLKTHIPQFTPLAGNVFAFFYSSI